MNIYLLVIISTLLGLYILNMVLNYLEVKSLDPTLPEEFLGFYDKNEYSRSQEYTKVKVGFSKITSTFSIILTILMILMGGFNFLDIIVRSWGYGQIATGLLYMAVLGVLSDIISLPFELYSTFVIEEKFGFNKTTIKTYITDKIKGYLLAAVLGGILLSVILYFFETVGPLAWLYCWIASTVFLIIVQFLAPTLILPLFNKFTPLEDGELKSTIKQYAEKIKFNLEGIYIIDGSKRSTKSNAFFTGFGSKKRIALFDTLVEKHTIGELLGILAHEVGHYKKKHIIKMLVVGILKTGFVFYLMSLVINNQGLFDAFKMENMSIYAGLIFFSMLYTPISFLFSIIMNVNSRKYEYEADKFAIETTNSPEDMISALKKLSVHNLSNLTPHWLEVLLNYSHPPVLERITAIRSNVNC